jgi:ketosteroid isomerase-like protein
MDPARVRLYEQGSKAYVERGLDGLAESWDEDIVYEEDPLWPGAGTYSGRDAVLQRFREYEEQLGHGAATTDEVLERPGGVVIIWRHSGVTRGSGVPFEHRWAWVVQERDGKASHIRAYFDPEEALAAAGGREPAT